MVDNWKTLSDNSPLMTQSRPPFLTVTFPDYSKRLPVFCYLQLDFFCHRQPFAYLITLFDVNVTAFCNVFFFDGVLRTRDLNLAKNSRAFIISYLTTG